MVDHTFTKLVIQMWPILSLKKSMLKPKKLAKIIAKTAGVESDLMVGEETIDSLAPFIVLRGHDTRVRGVNLS
ncbi:hypothetical protein KUTeg_000724 [Tegillarca granosa]|uniref:Uncharacterized protein n=1 Tax=Tegillarca granosa TaxID=220873 RepID=A0ABQ9FYC7_TEGGR|nr:hypothetical protein KUTeg_000724 [Tegillarca granosa]